MTTSPPPAAKDERRWPLLLVIALLGVAVLILLAMQLSRPQGPVSGATTGPATPTAGATASGAGSNGLPSASATVQPSASAVLVITTPSPSPTRPATPAPTRAPTPAATSPVIVSFNAPATVKCTGSEVQQVTISWQVDRAAGVDLAIDGPGKYDSYPATYSVQVPFSCSEAQHTYRITSTGGSGPAATQEKVVKRTS